jgi:hypothetical protein
MALLAMATCTLLVAGTGQGQMQQSPDLLGNLVLNENQVDRQKATMPQPLARASGYYVWETAPALCSSSCLPKTP